MLYLPVLVFVLGSSGCSWNHCSASNFVDVKLSRGGRVGMILGCPALSLLQNLRYPRIPPRT